MSNILDLKLDSGKIILKLIENWTSKILLSKCRCSFHFQIWLNFIQKILLLNVEVNDRTRFRVRHIARFMCVSFRLHRHRIKGKCVQIPCLESATPTGIWMLVVHDWQEFVQGQQSLERSGGKQLLRSIQADGIAQGPIGVSHGTQKAVASNPKSN